MTYKEDIDNFLKYLGKSKGKLDKKSLEIILHAIDALSSRDPKAPDIYGDGYADGELVLDMWRCPSCGTSYEIEFEKYGFCPTCGQAIDWSGY